MSNLITVLFTSRNFYLSTPHAKEAKIEVINDDNWYFFSFCIKNGNTFDHFAQEMLRISPETSRNPKYVSIDTFHALQTTI